MCNVLSLSCVGKAKNLVDIIYVIGSNGNQAREIFNKEKDIIKDMLASGSTANTKYSIIQYGKEHIIKARFSDLSTPEDVKRLLDQLQWENEGKSITESLAVASLIFKSDPRRDSKKVLVVFTGETVEPASAKLKDLVNDLAKNEVKIIPVVVGSSPDASTFVDLVPSVQDPISGRTDEDSSGTADEIGKKTFTGNFVKHLSGRNTRVYCNSCVHF